MTSDPELSVQRRKPSLRERRPSLWKISISLLCFVLTFLSTNFVVGSANLLWSVSVGLFFASVTFVVQFLLDVEERLREARASHTATARSTAELIDQRFRQIGDATDLYALAGVGVLSTAAIHDLVRSLAAVVSRPPLVQDLVRAEFVRFARFTKEVSEGTHVAYDGEDRDWLLALAALTTETIDTVSIVTVEDGGQLIVDGGPWRSDRASRFFEAQRAALQPEGSAVVIRRIFVVQQPSVADFAEFADLRGWQETAGIQTRVLDLSARGNRQHRTLPEFILFDGTACYEPSPAARTMHGERPTIISTRLDFDTDRVGKLMQRFEKVWKELDGT